MGLALRMLLVDPCECIYRFSLSKFDEMRRNPAKHRYSSRDNGYEQQRRVWNWSIENRAGWCG